MPARWSLAWRRRRCSTHSRRGFAQADAHQDIRAALLERISDEDPFVRLQLSYSVGANAIPLSGRLLAQLAGRDADDPYAAAAILSSVRADNLPDVLYCLPTKLQENSANRFFDRLIATAVGVKDERTLQKVVEQIVSSSSNRDKAWKFSAMAELIDGCHRRNISLDQRLNDETRGRLLSLFADARLHEPT